MPLSFETLNAAEAELQKQFAEFAVKSHLDAHTYTLKKVGLRVAKCKDPKWVAVVSVELDAVYDFDDDPIDETYSFRYGIAADGSLGRYHPENPTLQLHIFQAYDTWGDAVAAWVKSVQGA